MEHCYKHSAEVRAYMAQVKREYRARKKVREAQAGKREASLTPTTPREVATIGDNDL